MVSNPEFLKEGAAVADCMRPDRIVIGTGDPESEELLREVYAPFSRNHDKLIVMDVRSAELTKYAANAMLATKISFMNEIANLAERLGADVEMVRQGIGSDSRIGYQFIYPGAGYGGSCFPKDVKALDRHRPRGRLRAGAARGGRGPQRRAEGGARREDPPPLRRRPRGADLRALGPRLQAEDRRHARGRLARGHGGALGRRGARVQAFDPEAMEEAQRLYGDREDLVLCGTKEAALKGADALVVVTEWQAFRAPDFDLIRERLKAPVIFDGRNLYDPARMARRGFAYYAIGRGLRRAAGRRRRRGPKSSAA